MLYNIIVVVFSLKLKHNSDFRELLLGQLMEYMKTVQKDFMACSAGEKSVIPSVHCAPELINDITWIRQLDSKVI